MELYKKLNNKIRNRIKSSQTELTKKEFVFLLLMISVFSFINIFLGKIDNYIFGDYNISFGDIVTGKELFLTTIVFIGIWIPLTEIVRRFVFFFLADANIPFLKVLKKRIFKEKYKMTIQDLIMLILTSMYWVNGKNGLNIFAIMTGILLCYISKRSNTCMYSVIIVTFIFIPYLLLIRSLFVLSMVFFVGYILLLTIIFLKIRKKEKNILITKKDS